MMTWFINIIVRHPYTVLLTVSVFSCFCLMLPMCLKKFPDFTDPQLGFETRGTVLAQRLVAWENLNEATKSFGQFAVNPKDILLANSNNNVLKKKKVRMKKKEKFKLSGKLHSSLNSQHNNLTEDFVKISNWKSTKKNRKLYSIKNSDHQHKHDFFCGSPDERYARVVLTTEDDRNLFTYESFMSMCHIEHQLMQPTEYRSNCDTVKRNQCCHIWSVANYVALLHNRASCLAITEEDIDKTLILLQSCSQYYHNLHLTHDCADNSQCRVPRQCSEHNAAYNILHYLTDTNFLPPNEHNKTTLKHSMMFLPVACSTKSMDYFQQLQHRKLGWNGLNVVAMELGLKSALFDEYLVRDAWLVAAGGLCVLLCMWSYTHSVFMTFVTVTAIGFSLVISYCLYTLVFQLHFFPFMNLLATVLAVGIGADDAFIFCKVWRLRRPDKEGRISELVADTMRHAVPSMTVTSLTTAAALYTSLMSSITAVRCFSAFAGTAVLINLVLMTIWLPACAVIQERWVRRPGSGHWLPVLRVKCTWPQCDLQRWLRAAVLRLRHMWLLVLGLTSACSVAVVLRLPGLQLPDSPNFQLFKSTHPFEQYDLVFKHKFWFERLHKVESRLPLRFVWGIIAADNGDHMDPRSKGTLLIDSSFDVAHPDSQSWLLGFCQRLKSQPFFQPSPGPLLPNCFIESLEAWMQRRCADPIDGIDRSPCCETTKFPYTRAVFQTCVVKAMADLYETPVEYFMPGVAGPKFSRQNFPHIGAIVVEYDSNHTFSMSYAHMDIFFKQVEAWTQRELASAPVGMRGGWFVSELDFYDLQRELSEGTTLAVCVSMGVALVVLAIVTLNLLISIYAVFTITCTIFTTMAVLVLLGWRLGVLESVAVSTAVGLAVDFCLHYGVSYVLCGADDRRSAVRLALDNMAGPTVMAAITTAGAGIAMLPSSVLAYVQIGTFLAVVMLVSWLHATFLFGALLAVIGPQRDCGQLKRLLWWWPEQHDMLSDSMLSTVSTVCAPHTFESHELESLAGQQHSEPPY